MTTKPKAKSVSPAKGVPFSVTPRLEALGISHICEYISTTGESLNSWCKINNFSITTVHDWIHSDAQRAEKYARARDVRADTMFESLDEVSESAAKAKTAVEVAGLRLKADNIKWKVGRMVPKKYGDKLDLNHGGQPDNPITVVETVIVQHEVKK